MKLETGARLGVSQRTFCSQSVGMITASFTMPLLNRRMRAIINDNPRGHDVSDAYPRC